MIASVLLFCWARDWKIQSKFINWVSISVLSVYIIHMGPATSQWFFESLQRITAQESAILVCAETAAFMLGFYALCILIDKVRILICTPINRGLTSFAERGFSKLSLK